jgi:phosphoadenosine phosphosulfate reductase
LRGVLADAGALRPEDLEPLVDGLHFKQKVDRALGLIAAAHAEFGEGLVVANSLGTNVTWDLAKRVSPDIRGFIIVTPHSHPETHDLKDRMVARYPELQVYENEAPIPQDLCRTDPDRCCELLKVEPARRAVAEMGVECLVTGVRCTAGRTRRGFREVERRAAGLVKLNPILLWHEREVWQYAALNHVEVNPLFAEGYRSLGCAPCTRIVAGEGERAGRWIGSSKCGGECGLNTKPLKFSDGAGI